MTAEVVLPVLAEVPTTIPMTQEVGLVGKPDIDLVIAYAQKQVDKHLKDFARHIPEEQKDEIRQEALFRVVKAYPNLDPTLGWKSFVQTHSRGALKDYLRGGTGFKETQWEDLRKEIPEQLAINAPTENSDSDGAESPDSEEDDLPQAQRTTPGTALPPTNARKFKQRLSKRVEIVNHDDNVALDVGEIAGLHGVHSEQDDSSIFKPRWDLVARMAAVDAEIHLVAKILRGFTQTELAPGFEVSREMLSQRIRIFFKKLDAPEFYGSPWVAQTIYAFGLEELYHMDPVDLGIGWDKGPVDLDSAKSLELMDLFVQESFKF